MSEPQIGGVQRQPMEAKAIAEDPAGGARRG